MFCTRLDALRDLRGHQIVNSWQTRAQEGHTAQVVQELLQMHYDPIYLKSMQRNFVQISTPQLVLSWDGSEASLQAAADKLLAQPLVLNAPSCAA